MRLNFFAKTIVGVLFVVLCFGVVSGNAAFSEVRAKGAAAAINASLEGSSVGTYDDTVEVEIGAQAAYADGISNLDATGNKTFTVLQASIVNGILGPPTSGGASLVDGSSPQSQGAFGQVALLTSRMFSEPPARTDVYIADALNSAGFAVAQPAYAQGLGFAALSPILSAWKNMRNLAYYFFVLIFLVIGFLIMLRHKVGGQTAITAQQAIPRVIISLLAVTFSYAIAGLLIDGMYLFMYLLVGVFGASTNLVNLNFLGLSGFLLIGGATSVYEVVSSFIRTVTSDLDIIIGETLSWLGGLSIAVVVSLALLFGIFKLFFILLRTYVNIIVSIVLAPLLLMVGAIPGQNVFGKWLKQMVGNLIAFPVVLIILLIFDQLTGSLSGVGTGAPGLSTETGGFVPPYLVGIGSGNVIVFLIGFGMILIIGDLVDQAKQAMGAGKGPFDALIQSAIDTLNKGWRGGQLIDGLGFTDTRKWGFGGLTGLNVLRKGAIGGAAGGAAAYGGTINLARQGLGRIPVLKSQFVPGSERFGPGMIRKQFGTIMRSTAAPGPAGAATQTASRAAVNVGKYLGDEQITNKKKKE